MTAAEQKLKKLTAKVTKGLKLLKESDAQNHLCEEGDKMFRELAKEVGVNIKDFDEDDFKYLCVEETNGYYDVDSDLIQEMLDKDDIDSMENVVDILNARCMNWRLAILDKDNNVVMEHSELGRFQFSWED